VADFGYSPEDLAGLRLDALVHPEDRAMAIRAVRAALGMPGHPDAEDDAAATSVPATPSAPGAPPAPANPSGTPVAAATAVTSASPDAADVEPGDVPGRFPVRVRTADGTWRHIESTIMRYRVPGEQDQLLVTARDMSDQVALRQQVTHLTFHDGLTGLPNRAYLEERARDALRRSGDGTEAGVVFLDLDGFTAVNDSVGHGAGDLVLAQAARRLRAIVPPHDTVARWGGDEFAVPRGEPGHRADRERRRGPGRRLASRARAAERRRRDVQGEGQRWRPG
jgi:GGDEF domain-containing protein